MLCSRGKSRLPRREWLSGRGRSVTAGLLSKLQTCLLKTQSSNQQSPEIVQSVIDSNYSGRAASLPAWSLLVVLVHLILGDLCCGRSLSRTKVKSLGTAFLHAPAAVLTHLFNWSPGAFTVWFQCLIPVTCLMFVTQWLQLLLQWKWVGLYLKTRAQRFIYESMSIPTIHQIHLPETESNQSMLVKE